MRQKLETIVIAELQYGNWRTFLSDVWNIFENSEDEQSAKAAYYPIRIRSAASSKINSIIISQKQNP